MVEYLYFHIVVIHFVFHKVGIQRLPLETRPY